MKKKVLSIIVVAFIVIISIIIYNFIVNDDDFAPYTNKEYDETYDISSDIYDVAVIKNELASIVEKYEEGVKLTYIEYDIKGNSKTAEFQFYKNDYNGKNKACVVTVIVDVDAKKVTKIKYEKGHGKRVTGYSNEINISEDVLDYINPNESIKIIVANNEITLFKDDQRIETTDFIKDITNKISDGIVYEGVITEINSDDIIFENQSTNQKYLIYISNNFKYINGRTNEELDINDLKVGYYISTFSYDLKHVISILSDIKGEELKKELIKNLSLENPLYWKTTITGKELNIINDNKAILTLTMKDLVEDYNADSEFEMKVELNSNTTIECKGGYNKIEQLEDVSIDVINVILDENTINNEIPVATWFMSSNGN